MATTWPNSLKTNVLFIVYEYYVSYYVFLIVSHVFLTESYIQFEFFFLAKCTKEESLSHAIAFHHGASMSLFVLVSVNLILKPLFFLAFEIVGWMFQSSQPFFKTCLLKVILVVHTSTFTMSLCVYVNFKSMCIYICRHIYVYMYRYIFNIDRFIWLYINTSTAWYFSVCYVVYFVHHGLILFSTL